jgi:hypothetical protein
MLLIVFGIIAAIASAGTAMFIPAIVIAVLAFWSNGVLANFRGDLYAAPNWASAMSALCAVASLGMIVAAIVLHAAG